jgi:hypothetical protein
MSDIETLLDKIAKADEKNLVAYVGKRTEDVDASFVMLFIQTTHRFIINKIINTADISILLFLVDLAAFGNAILLRFSNTAIAEKLKLDRGNVSRSISKMTKLGIILNIEGALYLNPFMLSKGRLGRIKSEILLEALKYTDLIPCPYPKLLKAYLKEIEEPLNADTSTDETELPF